MLRWSVVLLAVALSGCLASEAPEELASLDAGPESLLVVVRNDGNVDLQYELTVSTPSGASVDGSVLGPGGSVSWREDMSAPGTYEAGVEVEMRGLAGQSGGRAATTRVMERAECADGEVVVTFVAEPRQELTSTSLGLRSSGAC